MLDFEAEKVLGAVSIPYPACYWGIKFGCCLFVTHDINEALKLGTRMIVMNAGKVCQFDTPRNIARDPADGFVASLMKSCREQEKFWEGLE